MALVKGADDSLVRERVHDLVDELVGAGDRAMMVDDVTLPDRSDSSLEGEADLDEVIGAAIGAANTAPFLTDRRVVVVRGCARLGTREDVAALVQYLTDPLPTTSLVLVWDLPAGSKGRRATPPKSLVAAIDACGGRQIDVNPGKKIREWIEGRLKDEPYRLDADAVALLVDQVGDDPATLVGQLTTLRGVFAPGQRVSAAELEPHLGVAGGVAPWAVTDAIEAGDPAGAVSALQRMLGPGERHPLQVLATLSSYVGNMLALEGAGVATRDEAARVLGVHPFVAAKALAQSQRLGSAQVHAFVRLVAEADLDARGRRRMPDELVLEVLVARLASRARAAGRRGGTGSRSGSAGPR